MSTTITEMISSFKEKRHLAVTFMERHNKELTGVTLADLADSGDELERQIYALFCGEPDWKEILALVSSKSIPSYWNLDEVVSPSADGVSHKPSQELAGAEGISHRKNNLRQSPSNQWHFNVAYFLTVLPVVNSAGGLSIASQALPSSTII